MTRRVPGLMIGFHAERARKAFERIDAARVVAFRSRDQVAFTRLDRAMFAAWRTYLALRARAIPGGAS